jgi:hypothetical protein
MPQPPATERLGQGELVAGGDLVGRKFSENRPHRLPRETPSKIKTRQLLSPILKHPITSCSLDTYCTERTKT